MGVKHKKTDTIPNWTQAELNAQIALGNYPPGTTLADIVLPGDWNDDHLVSIAVTDITATGTPSSSTWLRGDGVWAGNPLGDVTGPVSSTDNAIALFDGVTGKLLKNSTALISATGTLILTPQASANYVAGGLAYDSGKDCFTAYNGNPNVALQIGRENWSKCLNNSGVAIPNGAAVTITGASGGNPTIALAQANTSTFVLGLATQAIANGATGEVTTYGEVNGVDTSTFAAGAVLYVSATVAGGFTTTAPVAPNYRIRVGTVGVSSATVGTVVVSSPTTTLGNGAANQLMAMNTAGTAPEYKTVSSTTSITAVQAAGALSFQRAALTGDITAPVNSNATTLATVNANVGTFGSASVVPVITANGKGLITAVTTATITPAAIGAPSGSGTSTGTNTGDQTTITGNAGTATALQTARTISGVSFNGTANINVPGFVTTPSRAVVSDASGYTIASAVTATELGYVSGVTSAIQTQLNAKQGTLTLTTTGTSGAATLVGNTLNIPNYAGSTGTVTAVSVVNANGVSGSVANPSTTPAITITLGAITPTSVNGTTATEIGYVSGVTSAIQTQINGKQAAGNYITDLNGDGFATGPGNAAFTLATTNSNVGTFGSSSQVGRFTVNGKGLITSASAVTITPAAIGAPAGSGNSTGTNTGDQTITLTGEATGTGTGSFPVTLTNSAVTGKALTGFISGSGTVAATDTILQAVQKLDGNDGLKAPLASPTFTGTVTTPNLTVTNPISGSITGNAATVTTNANLTGAVTSVGNATSLGSFTSAQLATALTDEVGTGNAVFQGAWTSFTPTTRGTTVAGVGTYTKQYGRYCRTGNVIRFEGIVVTTAHTGTGFLQIAGLPLATNAADFTVVNIIPGQVAAGTGQVAYAMIPAASSLINLYIISQAAGSVGLVAMDASVELYFSGEYGV